MKKLITLLILLLVCGLAKAQFGGGDGTSGDPYQISTDADMALIATNVNVGNTYSGICFKLMNDIDLSTNYSPWTPIGNSSNEFRGIFDGNSQKITGLTISSGTSDYCGLFGFIGYGCAIKDLTIESCSISTTGSYVGALVGEAYLNTSNQNITIDNCKTSGNITAKNCCGGLIGNVVQNPSATGGDAYSIIISNSSSSVTVSSSTGNNWVGGLVGNFQGWYYLTNSPQLKYCYATGNVSNGGYIGGLVGNSSYAIISNCYATGNVSATSLYPGGLIGYTGASSISNCYSKGSVSGKSAIKVGFTGSSTGSTITNCFWDITTSKQTGSAGGIGVIGKTTTEMKTQTTFTDAGWDFTSPIWLIDASHNNNYPYLNTHEYTWTGAYGTNWNYAGNWTPNLVPYNQVNVTILPSYNPSTLYLDPSYQGVCNDITINSGGKLVIWAGKDLTVNGSLTNNNSAGTVGVEILSGTAGTGSLIINGSASGTGAATAQRWMTAGKWNLISSPLSGQLVSDFISANTDIIAANSTTRGMMDYNPGTNLWNSFFIDGADNGSLSASKGFSLRLQGTTPVTNDAAVTFKGSVQAGSLTTSALTTGWNCIGNPYTSAIGITNLSSSTNNFITVNASNFASDSYQAIYIWDKNDSQNGIGYYTAINNTSGTHDVQQGQAFMVNAASGSIFSFTNAMQLHSPALVLKSAQIPWPSIKLKATINDQSSSTLIAFNSNMTKGLDPSYDAGLLKGGADLIVYTKLVEDNGIQFAIQALPDNDFTNMIIPIGLDFKTGGEVTFSSQLTNLPSNCKAILEDKLTKTFTDLSTDVYKVTITANSSITDRFFLHTSAGVSLPEKLTAYANRNIEIRLSGTVSKNAVATLYDIHGRVVVAKYLETGNLNIIPTPNLKTGIYLLSVNDNGKRTGIKILVTE